MLAYFRFFDRAEHEPNIDLHQKLKFEEQKALDSYVQELKSNEFFKACPPNIQKLALKGIWKSHGWYQLAANAKFEEQFFKQHYKLLSSYSHSGRHSIMQTQQARTLEQQTQMIRASTIMLVLTLAKFIFDYIELFPTLQVEKTLKSYQLILFWKNLAETINWDDGNS